LTSGSYRTDAVTVIDAFKFEWETRARRVSGGTHCERRPSHRRIPWIQFRGRHCTSGISRSICGTGRWSL